MAYPVHIGYNLLTDPTLFQPFFAQKRVFIVSHPEIQPLYLQPLINTCQAAGVTDCNYLLIPSGEKYKTLFYAEQIWSALIKQQHHRDSILIALGGGMMSDLVGFSAACYLRGISVVYCPTTLLAQVDAAIGGKTAVNHPEGKNMIGAFHAPLAVISDLATLDSLPQREYCAAFAELIKYGITLDSSFLTWLENHLGALLEQDRACLQTCVQQAVRLKEQVVALDEKEKKLRMLLNFGHTIGHALESLLEYEQILHGEAIALGMIAATQLSVIRGLDTSVLERLIVLLKRCHLPTVFPTQLSIAAIIDKLNNDKKHHDQQLHWVLLNGLGQPYLSSDVTTSQIISALKACGVQ